MSNAAAAMVPAGVFVVDDDALWRRTLQRLLSSLMIERIYLSAGPNEFGKMLDRSIDNLEGWVVLTDLEMYGDLISGWAVVELSQRAGLPVAILSGAMHSSMRPQVRSVPWLRKQEVTPQSLQALVGRLHGGIEIDAGSAKAAVGPAA